MGGISLPLPALMPGRRLACFQSRDFFSNRHLYSEEVDTRACRALEATREWFQGAVIRHRLCPFAIPLHANNAVQFHVSRANNLVDFTTNLLDRYKLLVGSPRIETELIIAPFAEELSDFMTFTFVCNDAEKARDSWIKNRESKNKAMLAAKKRHFTFVSEEASPPLLDTAIQFVLFHPQFETQEYQMSNEPRRNSEKITEMTNYTNRSPFPTVHLLRDSHVAEATKVRHFQ